MDADPSRQVRVRFVTKLAPPLRAPRAAIAVPADLSPMGLSETVNGLLAAAERDHKAQPFDFLVDGELVRQPLQQCLLSKGISEKRVLELEYVKAVARRKRDKPSPDDDSDSTVDASNPRLHQRKESLVEESLSDDKDPPSICTIVISNLESCMDEKFLYNCFAATAEVTGIVLKRDETTNAPKTALIEFSTHTCAKKAKENINGKPRPDMKGFMSFEMRWASTNLDRSVKGPHKVTYKSDESSDSDTASTFESFESESSD